MKVNRANKKEWGKILNTSDTATFFHTKDWLNLIKETDKTIEENSLQFVFRDGTIAILPMIKKTFRGRFFNINLFESSAMGTYGGLISNKKLNSEKYKKIFKWLNKNIKNFIIRTGPNDNLNYNIINKLPKVSVKEDFTHSILLEGGYNNIFKNFSKGHKYNIKKARKNNIQIKKATDLSEYLEYYKVYADSCKRWGKKEKDIDINFFKNAFNLKGGYSSLWLAIKDGKIISGALVFYFKNRAIWWNGATLKKYFPLYPANLLQDEIIKDAEKRGFACYDLNPSDSLEGVIKFKESYGAKKSKSFLITKKSVIQKISNLIHKIKNFKIKSNNKTVFVFLNDGYGKEYLIKYLSLIKKNQDINFKIIFSIKFDYKNLPQYKKIIKKFIRKLSPKTFTEKLLKKNKVKYALEENINSKIFLKKINNSIGIISGFDQIFNEKTISHFNILINFHPSLLPSYRGPIPSYWVIRNNEKFSGISVHKVSSKIDSGEILYNDFLEILPEDNEYSLDKRLSVMGSRILDENFNNIIKNKIIKKIKYPINKLKPSYYSSKKV